MGTSAEARIPISRACLAAKKSYNQLRRLLALGRVRGGWDPEVGYFIEGRELKRLARERTAATETMVLHPKTRRPPPQRAAGAEETRHVQDAAPTT